MNKRWILVAALTMVMGCVITPKNSQKLDDLVPAVFPPEKVAHYDRDVVWASPGGHDLTLDVSRPEGDGPFPVLVWIHGGGWEMFSKEANEGLACYVTNRGYVVFNVNYRMHPEVTMKTIIEDAMGAVIWAKSHAAEYHGDPHRVAVAGHSAGGHLTAMIGVACGDPYFTPTYDGPEGCDCTPDAFIPVSGVYDFMARAQKDPERWTEIFGASYDDDPELYKKCSPVSYVRSDLPPELVIYAGDEDLRPANEDWIKMVTDAGAPIESYMQPGQEHVWITWHWKKPAQQSFDRLVQFLDQQFKEAK